MRHMPGPDQRLNPGRNHARVAPSRGAWLTAFALCLTSIAASADFDTAADAYRRQDYVTAYAQFEPLAHAGDPRAQTVVALMYKYGESVKPNFATSFAWYMRAAEQGYAPAQFNVGQMLAEGQGVAPNRDQALAWLRKAAANGYDRARGELKRLGQSAGRSTGEIREWSQAWDFSLPNRYRYGAGAAARPAPESAAVESDEPTPVASFKVQLGAMGTRAAAEALWTTMVKGQPGLFGNLSPRYLRSEGNRTIYRLQAGPFANLAAARSFCAQVHSAAGCLPLEASSDEDN